MADIWFISDTHFSHANMLRFTDDTGSPIRPGFRDVTHMDETMIERWNRVVKPGDKVYHLGDVGFGVEELGKIMPRLHGKKRLILGNHDQHDMGVYRKYFQKIMAWRAFVEDDAAFICSHFPIHTSSFLGRYPNCANVHGHIHVRTIPDPRYINICVEQINYTPVNYDWILKKVRKLGA